MEYKAWIAFIVLACVGVILLGALIDSAAYYTDSAKNTMTNDTITFTLNNTCYYGSRGPMATITTVYSNTSETADTYAAGASSLTNCNGGLKIYTNGTGADPNVTTGAKFVTYTVYKPTGLGGTVVGLMVAVFIMVVILIYLGYV